jgi:hypothetical protein
MLGVTDDELRALLLRHETYRPRSKAERAKKDAELMAAIRSVKRQRISAGKDRNTVVSVPTQSRHRNDMIPDIILDINICFFNNGSLNNSTENISRKGNRRA